MNYLLCLTLFAVTTSCISAGESVLSTYTQWGNNQKEIENRLNDFCSKNPGNRVNSDDIKSIQNVFPLMFSDCLIYDSTFSNSSPYVFKKSMQISDYERERWYIKSSDGKLIFCINICNCNYINCDIGLLHVMFLDSIQNNFRNWQLTSVQKKEARLKFRHDILNRLPEVPR